MTGKEVADFFATQKFFRDYLETVPPDEVADYQRTQETLTVFVDGNQDILGSLPCTTKNVGIVMKCFTKLLKELEEKEETNGASNH